MNNENELTAALLTIEKCRDLTNCPAGVDLQDWVKQLAAENVALKATNDDRRMFIMNGVQLGYIKVPTVETDPALETIRIAVSPQEPTPATDRIVAGIKADAANQMCVAFVKHKELAGLSDDDAVTVREATDAVLHCAEVISEGADK